MNKPTQDKAPAAERRAFKMDPALLWSVIKSQAGTLAKAVLELVMNSIDAGGTKVLITLNARQLIVEDDGRGFQSRKEIEDWFETFGTPHKAGDALIGRFRMGRGQVMGFTRSVWRSGAFQMRVDIRDLGLAYDLVDDLPLHKGCRVEGDLYETLQPSDLIRTIDNLRAMCKYTPVPVFVNGEQISLDPTKEKWTLEDDDAFYLLRDSARSMAVYNLGVHTRDFWHGELGIGGVTVSKRALEVNFARNDILVSECPVYKRIATQCRAFAKLNEKKKPAQNEQYRDMVMQRLLTGNFDSLKEYQDAVADEKVFTDYSGKHMSLMAIRRATHHACGQLVWVDEHSTKADRVHQAKLAIVLSPKTYERAGKMGFHEVLNRLASNLKAFDSKIHFETSVVGQLIDDLRESIGQLDEVGKLIDNDHRMVPYKELSKEERLTLGVLNKMQWYMSRHMCQTVEREIKVCESESMEGFTDGRSVIFVERKFLKVGGSAGHALKAFERVKALLVHEYAHDSDSSTGHGHPAEFFERFHEVMIDTEASFGFAYEATRMYLAARRKAGLKMRGGDLHTIDMVGVDEESSDSKEDASPATEPGATKVPTAREEAAKQQELV